MWVLSSGDRRAMEAVEIECVQKGSKLIVDASNFTNWFHFDGWVSHTYRLLLLLVSGIFEMGGEGDNIAITTASS